MKQHIILLTFCLGVNFLGGVSSQATTPAASSQNKEPVHISSDEKMVFDEHNSKVSAYVNAVVQQGKDSLKANEIHGYFKKQAHDTKDSDKYDLERIEAIGNVKVVSPNKVATGDYGNYYLDKEQIILEGNVTISDGTNEVKGEYGVMDRVKGTTQIYSTKPGCKKAKGHRVKALLTKVSK